MARSMSLASTIFVFLLLLVANEMVAEARTCESQSQLFKGLCLSDTNCASVCLTEGFPDGHCKGLRGMCFCVKNCI